MFMLARSTRAYGEFLRVAGRAVGWSESGGQAGQLVAGLSELADGLFRLLFGLRLIWRQYAFSPGLSLTASTSVARS
jgi:X-X-X-Leu-X-X-Gly heptad repeat protein